MLITLRVEGLMTTLILVLMGSCDYFGFATFLFLFYLLTPKI